MTDPADNDTQRRRLIVIGSILAVLLAATAGGVAYIQASSESATKATTTTTTTSTTAKPTTTATPSTTTTGPAGPKRRSPAGTFTIATLKKQFPYALVSKTLPPAAATAKRQELEPKGAPPFNPDTTSRQPLPNLKYQIEGRTALDVGWRFDSPGPFGEVLTFAVTARQGDYLEVRLPARPNGTRGWVTASAFDLTTTRIQIEVILAEHRVRAWDGNTLIADAPVAVGTPDTKTPTGRHYIVDTEQRDPGGLYGPWILGLDAYSEDMDSFDGGAPQIALHGWQNEEAFGRSVSNGCIRMPNDVIEQLSHAPLGTPVDVWAA